MILTVNAFFNKHVFSRINFFFFFFWQLWSHWCKLELVYCCRGSTSYFLKWKNGDIMFHHWFKPTLKIDRFIFFRFAGHKSWRLWLNLKVTRNANIYLTLSRAGDVARSVSSSMFTDYISSRTIRTVNFDIFMFNGEAEWIEFECSCSSVFRLFQLVVSLC